MYQHHHPEEISFEDWYAIECVRRTRRDPSNIKYEWTLYLHAEKKVKNWEELIQKSIRKFYLVFTLHDVESDQQSIHTSSLSWLMNFRRRLGLVFHLLFQEICLLFGGASTTTFQSWEGQVSKGLPLWSTTPSMFVVDLQTDQRPPYMILSLIALCKLVVISSD